MELLSLLQDCYYSESGEEGEEGRGESSLVPRPRKTSSLVLTVCALMHMCFIPKNLGNLSKLSLVFAG